MGKGEQFERDISKKLSLWWSDGERDDIFWRTAGSGGRARRRSKDGKSTFGQYGDLCAVDPIGQPLIDACTIELKCGYGGKKGWSVMDVLDKPKRAKTTTVEKFISQAEEQKEMAGTEYWLLICKRDYCHPVVIYPKPLGLALIPWFGDFKNVIKFLNCYMISLETWVKFVNPQFFV